MNVSVPFSFYHLSIRLSDYLLLWQPENIMTMELVESSVPEVKLINMERAREIPESSDIVMKKGDANIEYEGRGFSEDECSCIG